jgi:hypothetical protein
MVSTATVSIPDPVEPVSEAARRDRVYKAVADHVSELVDARVRDVVERQMASLAAAPEGEPVPDVRVTLDLPTGKAILAGITEIIFTAALREGYFRFPDGYGSFRVQRLTANPRPKRLPTGVTVKMPTNRVKFKYEDGAAVREALGLSKKTNYVRRYDRESRLSEHTKELLTNREA